MFAVVNKHLSLTHSVNCSTSYNALPIALTLLASVLLSSARPSRKAGARQASGALSLGDSQDTTV